MKLYRLIIENFRGIRTLDWAIQAEAICLIGASNATKTTVLEAIHYALYPTWNLVISDADFHQGNTSSPIRIVVTVGELPARLTNNIYKYGDCYGGRSSDGKLKDEPEGDDELTLTIELQVDDTLEPKWLLRSSRAKEEKEISQRDRELLGTFRVGNFVDRDFVWGKGTAISKLTAALTNNDEVTPALTKAGRIAKQHLQQADFPDLVKVTTNAAAIAQRYGAPLGDLRPDMDSQITGSIALHDGKVPVRLAGLGTRRLLAIGIQSNAAVEGSITLIDEVEQGLEPYRLRNLIGQLLTEKDKAGQVFMTTHSPIALSALKPEQIHLVHNRASKISIVCLGKHPDLARILNQTPEALLAKKILVCEGRTERGVCLALDNWWQKTGLAPLALTGVVAVVPESGGGRTMSPQVALALARLGYETTYLGDTDDPINPNQDVLTQAGVNVVVWEDNCCIEDRVFRDLDWAGVVKLLSGYISFKKDLSLGGLDPVLDAVGQQIERSGIDNAAATAMKETLIGVGDNYEDVIMGWKDSFELVKVRPILASASVTKKQPWYKSDETAKLFGDCVARYLDTSDQKTDLVKKLEHLRRWIYGE